MKCEKYQYIVVPQNTAEVTTNLPNTQQSRITEDLQISSRDHRNLGFSKAVMHDRYSNSQKGRAKNDPAHFITVTNLVPVFLFLAVIDTISMGVCVNFRWVISAIKHIFHSLSRTTDSTEIIICINWAR